MYDARVNITLHENPNIVAEFENNHLDEQSAVMQVLAEIHANDKMADASMSDSIVVQCAREALKKPEYRKRGVHEAGESVTVYSRAREQDDGMFAFDISESDDRVGPVDIDDVAGTPWDGGSHDLQGTIARREGSEYYVTIELTDDTVGPMSAEGFFS